MLGIGEVSYFSLKTVVFSRNDVFRVVGDEHQWLVVILFLIEKSPVNINCLFVGSLACLSVRRVKKNIEDRFSRKDISRGNSMRGLRI